MKRRSCVDIAAPDDQLDLARTCPGRSDGSVTEQTAWALSESIRSADFYIDLHTGGTELSRLSTDGLYAARQTAGAGRAASDGAGVQPAGCLGNREQFGRSISFRSRGMRTYRPSIVNIGARPRAIPRWC